MRITTVLASVVLGLILLGMLLGASPVGPAFQVVGIGGAGGVYTPAVSPYDPNLMFVSCDMGGSYRSTDGGRHWALIHWRQFGGSARSCYPTFLKDGGILWSIGGQIRISRDKGETWTELGKALPGVITHLVAVEPGQAGNDGLVLLVHAKGRGCQRSEDMGKTWRKVVANDGFSMAAVGKFVYFGGYHSLLRSADAGATWEVLNDQLVANMTAHALGGATDKAGSIIYASLFSGGVVKSTDYGATWKKVVETYADQKSIMVPWNQTSVAYLAQAAHGVINGKVWKTTDAGNTWQECFKMRGPEKNVELSWVQTVLGWGYYITENGFGVCPTDPNLLLLTTQGDFYISRNGGSTWQQSMNVAKGVLPGDPGQRYACNGMEVTSSWRYIFDPLDKNRRYIAYTDIGFARSVDKGQTWSWSAAGCPWSNTFYQVVCDPDVKGRLYAATGNLHDIPNWGFVTKVDPKWSGGVCVSENGGEKWTVLGIGLPVRPCTSLALDLRSPKNSRTLYATLFESGCWKSTNGGKTWVDKSAGLGSPDNRHALQVTVDPKSGDIYCVITAYQEGSAFKHTGGLWKSTNGGDSWTNLTADLALHWPGSCAVSPDNPNVIYLTAATSPGQREGGVYGTTDGGKRWKRLLRDEDFAATGGANYVQCFYVNIDPDNPDHVYIGTNGHGLWYSANVGKTWKRVDLPFASITNVTFDPDDKSIMYVGSFGGGVRRGLRQL